MKRTPLLGTALLLAFTTAACGGSDAGDSGDAGATETPSGAATSGGETGATDGGNAGTMTDTDWFQIDESAQTVTLNITAGSTSAQNYWNFNGFTQGNGSITVPQGYTVTVNFSNNDPNMAHSLGIEEWQDSYGGTVEVSPVFDGAVTSNPGSLTDATMPGESETITFTASTAGEYVMICYIPGHAQIGMYVKFIVSSDGSSGVMM